MIVVIVSKFGCWEEGTPVGLDKVAEVLFNRLISNFGLSIGSWVEGRGGVESNAKVFVEFFIELWDEDAPSVGDNCLWCPV